MKKLLAVLVTAALAMPAMAQTAIFSVTGDGSFDSYRSGAGEGYSNGGGGSSVRISKGNQGMGWVSFRNAVADGSGESLAAFLTANPGASATLYMHTANAVVPTGYAATLVSLRAGNQGGLVEDSGNGNGFAYTNPVSNFAGSSELVAFRGASPAPLAAFTQMGGGIYTLNDPASTLGVQGEPWITPSTRAANTGTTPNKFGPNEIVRWDTGLPLATNNKYIGYLTDAMSGGGGRSYWALEDVLGFFNNNSRNASLASITAAGQIVNTAQLTSAAYAAAGGVSPRVGTVQDNNWMAVAIDAAFLADMTNPENKGFVFATNAYNGSDALGVAGATLNNADFHTLNQNQSVSAYMVVTVPEPATMILLAMGGLALLRRRA